MLSPCCHAVIAFDKDLIQTPICSRCGKPLSKADLEKFMRENYKKRERARLKNKIKNYCRKAKPINNELLKVLADCNFDLIDHTILLGYRGSIVHGTYVPKKVDDKDIIGICIPPKEYYFGLQRFEQYEKFEGEWDAVIYSLQKYIRLLLKNNPNVMSLLWLEDKHYIHKTVYGQMLIENRYIFSSKLAYKSFCGYAYGQLHRMTHGAHQGYMGEKRKKLVEKFGYDCKNASHLIRLLKMGIEFLTTGELQVDRPEKHQLIEIKRGLWSLGDVKKLADGLFEKLELAYIKSKLEEKPDYEAANNLTVEITEGFLNEDS